MGITSTNRLDNLVFDESTVEDYSYMSEDTTLLDSIRTSGISIEESIVAQIAMIEQDYALFEQLLRDDYNGTMNEAFKTSSKEDPVEAGLKKIDKFTSRINRSLNFEIESVKDSAAYFNKKVSKIEFKDRENLEKYVKCINKEALTDFKGIKGFDLADKDIANTLKIIANLSQIVALVVKHEKAVRKCSTKEEMNEVVKDFSDEYNIIFNKDYELMRDTVRKKKGNVWKPADSDIKNMRNFVSMKEATKKMVSKILNDALKALKELKRHIDACEKIAKKDPNSIALLQMQHIYSMMYATMSMIEIRYGNVTSLLFTRINRYRRAILVCGKYCSKHGAVSEAVLEAIGLRSEAYVNAQLGNYMFMQEMANSAIATNAEFNSTMKNIGINEFRYFEFTHENMEYDDEHLHNIKVDLCKIFEHMSEDSNKFYDMLRESNKKIPVTSEEIEILANAPLGKWHSFAINKMKKKNKADLAVKIESLVPQIMKYYREGQYTSLLDESSTPIGDVMMKLFTEEHMALPHFFNPRIKELNGPIKDASFDDSVMNANANFAKVIDRCNVHENHLMTLMMEAINSLTEADVKYVSKIMENFKDLAIAAHTEYVAECASAYREYAERSSVIAKVL